MRERHVLAGDQQLGLPGPAVVGELGLGVHAALGAALVPLLLKPLGQHVEQLMIQLQLADPGLDGQRAAGGQAAAAAGHLDRRLVAPRGEVLDGEALVVDVHQGPDLGQGVWQPRVVQPAADQPAGEVELPGRPAGTAAGSVRRSGDCPLWRPRVVTDAEAQLGLAPQRAQRGQAPAQRAGQGAAELGRDFQALDRAAQRYARLPRIDLALEDHLSKVFAAQRALHFAALGVGGVGRRGQGQVHVVQHERGRGRPQRIEDLDRPVLDRDLRV